MDKYRDFQGECNSVTVKRVYPAGWNMAGYIPDCEPGFYDTFDEAKRAVIALLEDAEETASEAGQEDHAEGYCAAAEDVNLESKPFCAIVNHNAYWVADPQEVEQGFNVGGCDCCNDNLACDTMPVEGYNPTTKSVEDLGEICGECLYCITYGE